MVYLGFDDEEDVEESSKTTEEISEEKVKKIKEKINVVKLRPEREQKFRDEFDCVVVNDFGDIYHLTEEEREKKFKLYKSISKVGLKHLKKKYRNIVEWYKACQSVWKVVEIVAKNQTVYSVDDFEKKWIEGKIIIGGVRFPVYQGKDRKRLDFTWYAEGLLNNTSADEMFMSPEDEFDVVDENDGSTLFGEGELERIVAAAKEDEEAENEHKAPHTVETNLKKLVEKYDEYVSVEFSNKKRKEFFKEFPELLYKENEIKKEMRSIEHLSTRWTYDNAMNESPLRSMNQYVEDVDPDTGYVIRDVIGKVPTFHGEIMNSKGKISKKYKRYEQQMEDFLENKVLYEYHDSVKSKSDIEEAERQATMYNLGYSRDVISGFDEKSKKSKIGKTIEKKKKKLKRLREELDRDRRLKKKIKNGDSDDYKRSLSKKQKKKKKKKEKQEQEIDEFLLSVMGDKKHDDLNDLGEGVLDLRDVFGGMNDDEEE